MSDTQKNIDLMKDINEIAEKGIQAFELSYSVNLGTQIFTIHY